MIRRAVLDPDEQRPPFYDGMYPETARLTYPCAGCGQMQTRTLYDFLSAADVWKKAQTPATLAALDAYYQLPRRRFGDWEVVVAHGGGSPYFAVLACPHCPAQTLVYAGFGEWQPARYIARLQGVAEWED